MRVVAVLLACLVLSSCGSNWEGDVQFKVTRIAPPHEVLPGKMSQSYVVMSLDQKQPDSPKVLDNEGADIDQFPSDIKVGDVVICKVRQHDDNGFDGVEMTITVGPCQRP